MQKTKFQFKKILIIALVIYFVLLVIHHISNTYLLFDEAIYIGISKYLYSLGKSGFFEEIRPLGLPIMIGLPLLFKLPNLYFSKFLIMFFSLGIIFLSFVISNKIFNKKVAFLSIILLMITPLYFVYSTKILPHIPAIFFMLLGIYFYIKDRYFLSGIFSGLAFFIRFPYGILLISYLTAIFISQTKFDLNQFKINLKNFLKIFLGFFIITSPYLIFNYFYNIKQNLPFIDKIIHPFIFAVKTIEEPNQMYSLPFFYYFLNLFQQNFFLVIGIFGFLYLIYKYKFKNKNINIIIISFIFISLYFSYLTHKEARYSLSFLPFLAIFAAVGLYIILKHIIKLIPKISRFIIIVLIVTMSILIIVNIFSSPDGKNTINETKQDIINNEFELNKILSSNNNPIVSSSPFVTLYTNNIIIPKYYSSNELLNLFGQHQEAELLAILPSLWKCYDDNCIEQTKNNYLNIFNNLKIVFYRKINYEDLIILSRNNNATEISDKKKKELYGKYANLLSVSDLPSTKPIVTFRIDSVGDAWKENNTLINKENFKKINYLFIAKNIPITWAVIPKSFNDLIEEDKKFLINYSNEYKNIIEIAQDGYSFENIVLTGDYSEFNGLPLQEQITIIKKGKTILTDEFNRNIVSFIPPFNNGDKNTIKALEELGFKTYSSSRWDNACVNCNISVLFPNMYYIKDWSTSEFKEIKDLINEFQNTILANREIIFEFQMNDIGKKEISTLNQFIDYLITENTSFMTLNQLSEWNKRINNIELKYNQTNIILSKLTDNQEDEVSLLISNSGNYSIISDFSKIRIINIAPFDIHICLNNQCKIANKEQETTFDIAS